MSKLFLIAGDTPAPAFIVRHSWPELEQAGERTYKQLGAKTTTEHDPEQGAGCPQRSRASQGPGDGLEAAAISGIPGPQAEAL
ncbi:MAG: hypothetical protein JO052_13115 [Bradyrhizobium sp.]|nr:hypothetical protein [Bradyrhizobium sp.]